MRLPVVLLASLLVGVLVVVRVQVVRGVVSVVVGVAGGGGGSGSGSSSVATTNLGALPPHNPRPRLGSFVVGHPSVSRPHAIPLPTFYCVCGGRSGALRSAAFCKATLAARPSPLRAEVIPRLLTRHFTRCRYLFRNSQSLRVGGDALLASFVRSLPGTPLIFWLAISATWSWVALACAPALPRMRRLSVRWSRPRIW